MFDSADLATEMQGVQCHNGLIVCRLSRGPYFVKPCVAFVERLPHDVQSAAK